MLPRHLGRGAEALERVLEVLSARAAPRPKAEIHVTLFCFKSTRVYPFLYNPQDSVFFGQVRKIQTAAQHFGGALNVRRRVALASIRTSSGFRCFAVPKIS